MMRFNSLILVSACVAGAILTASSVAMADTINGDGVGTALPGTTGSQVVVAANPYSSANGQSTGTLNYITTGTGVNYIGETFTTGSNPGGYQLNSITVWDNKNSNTNGGWLSGTTENMNVFVPGATSMLYSGSGTVGTSGSAGGWVTYTFSTPPVLGSNTVYAYSFHTVDASTNNGYSPVGFNAGTGTAGPGSAAAQLATFSSSGTSTSPTYWTGRASTAAAVSATNDPTDVFTDEAEFQVVGTAIVPEPASLAVFAAGGLGLLLIGRKSRRAGTREGLMRICTAGTHRAFHCAPAVL